MENKPERTKANGLSIFLVDDDQDDRELFSEAIAEVDADIVLSTFPDGISLMEKLRSSAPSPDIIFLDLYMPKMDGSECLDEIRSDERFDSISIVLYSGLIVMERIEELFRKGANRYLRKPSSYAALVNALERTLESVAENPTGGMAVINYSE